jgi:hypothetical protein
MFLIDTSVWINVFRDRTGTVRQSLAAIINNENIIILNRTKNLTKQQIDGRSRSHKLVF